MAPTGRDACSRATPRATSCGARSTRWASRTGPWVAGPATGWCSTGSRVLAAVRCAPPANKPSPVEQATCRPFLVRELALLDGLRVIVPLGRIGWDATLRSLAVLGYDAPRPRPTFGHGAETRIGPYHLVGTYHPSQQNTFTGRLTPPMMEAVFARAVELVSA